MTVSEISRDLSALISALEPHILSLRTDRRTATSFAVDTDHYVTAAHTLSHGGRIRLVTADGTEIPADIVGVDRRFDLAVLSAANGPAPPTTADAEDLAVGHLVFPLGRPGRSLRAAFGIVSALGGPTRVSGGGELSRYIETDGSLPSGFSGGPLMDSSGRVLGMNTSLPRGSGMTVPIADIRSSMERISRTGDIRQGYLGVNTVPVPLESGSALMITEVEQDSPADRAGLKQGDVLTHLDGMPISDVGDLMGALSAGIAGRDITAAIRRAGRAEEITVRPEARD